jgi:type II secretory pathway pseudopilin PulG
MNTFNTRSRRGFGLLEVILVFALVLAASGTLFYVAQRATLTASTDADRQLVSSIAQNIGMIYKAGSWTSGNGPISAYTQSPNQFGGSTCGVSSDADMLGSGCVSRLAGTPIMIGEFGGGGYSPYPSDTGSAYYLEIQGASQEDCNTFLAGGPASLGGIAAFADYNPYGGPTGMHALVNGDGVVDFCEAAATQDGGTIASLNVVYGNAGFFPQIQ